MYVSLRSTRVQRFANSLAAGTRKRILGGGQAGPLRGSRWVSGNWALKRSLASLECPLGPGRAPAPGELARAERLHSSTGRPDSGATLQTSLGPRLRAQTARRRGAPSRVRTLGPADSTTPLYLAISPPAHGCGRGTRAAPGGEREQDLESVSVALDERRLLLPRPQELKFRARRGPGSWRRAFRDSRRGPRTDVRGRHIFRGSWLRRRGGEPFLGPGVLRRPRRRGASGFRPESLARRRPRRVSTAAVPAGRAGCRASPGRSRPGGGPRAAVRASALRSPRSAVPSGRGAAWRLGGARNTPLSPPPRLPRRCARAVRPVAIPGRAPGAERLPGARVLRAAPRGAGAQSLQEQRRPPSRLGAAGLARGRPGAPDQPEPPLASKAEAATAAAPRRRALLSPRCQLVEAR